MVIIWLLYGYYMVIIYILIIFNLFIYKYLNQKSLVNKIMDHH